MTINENDVVTAVCKWLSTRGYIIEQNLNTHQHGDDIIAVRGGLHKVRLMVEAKGATSSRQSSNRYGKPFDSAQIRDHIANYRAAQVLSKPTENEIVIAAIALPENPLHRRYTALIRPVLDQLGIPIFWVDENHIVQVESVQSL